MLRRAWQRSKVADALEAVSYGPGARIITQGDVGDIFYIIERGEAIITEDQSDKRLVFEAGKFFGEIALIEDVPRTAHVHAGESGAECLTLGRAAVNRLFVRPSHRVRQRRLLIHLHEAVAARVLLPLAVACAALLR